MIGLTGIRRLALALTTTVAVGARAEEPDMTVTFDPAMPTYKDLSKSRSFPDCGYAGCIADEGPEYCDEFFVLLPNIYDVELKAGENEILAFVTKPLYLNRPPADADDPLHIAVSLADVEFTCVDPSLTIELKDEELSIDDYLGEGV